MARSFPKIRFSNVVTPRLTVGKQSCLCAASWLLLALAMPQILCGQEEPAQDPTDQKQEDELPAGQPPTGQAADAQQPGPANIEPLMKTFDELIAEKLSENPELDQQIRAIANDFVSGKSKQAFEALQKMAESDEEFPPAEFLMAGLFFAVNQTDQGRGFLEIAATQHPNYPNTYTALARIAITQNRIADADALLEKAARLFNARQSSDVNQKHFRINYLDVIADIKIRRKQLDDAAIMLEELASLIPENPRVPLRAAEVQFEKGEIDTSVAMLNKVNEHATQKIVPELVIAGWFQRKKDVDNTDKWMDLAAQNQPDNPAVQLEYARWLMQRGRLPEAGQWLEKAEKNGGDKYAVTFVKGQLSFIRRAYDVAAIHFETLHRIRPGDLDSANLLALSLVENQDPQQRAKALELATINARLNPKSPAAVSALGWIHFQMGNQQQAEQLLGQVSRATSISPEIAFFLATILNAQGRPADAEKLLATSVDAPGMFLYRSRAQELLSQVAVKSPANEDDSNK